MSTQNNPINALAEAFSVLESENLELRESIQAVKHMMAGEDLGWTLLGEWVSGQKLEGLDLEEVHDIEDRISPKLAGSSLPQRAVNLHAGYVWGRGCFISGTQKPKKGSRGRPPRERAFFANPVNQESIFSESAHQVLQKARFASGNVLAACNTSTNEVNLIPFNQVTGLRTDPEFPEKITAYKRTWDTKDGTKNSVKSIWYYTTRHTGPRQKSFTDDGKTVPVAPNVTVVDLRVNRQPGFVLGIPDGLAGIAWAESYGRILSYGETVQEALASILFQVKSSSKKGAQQAGVKVSSYEGHGGTATMTDGQEFSAVSTAGRGYAFETARPVAAMAAAAWNVSNMDLLNDSSAAGSSYGSAQALVGGNRNAMLTMQAEWADFYKSIFEVMGFERPSVVFEPFETPDKYREAQAITLGSVALSDVEYRRAVLDALDIVGDADDIPDTLKNRGQEEPSAAAQQAAPDQGVSNGTNSGGQGANDQRSDTISSQEALRREMANEDYLNRLESLVERMEIVGGPRG